MLSIWTASTLSIACGSMESFNHESSLRRSRSCSSLVDGKSPLSLNGQMVEIENDRWKVHV